MGPVGCLLLGIVDNSLLPNSFKATQNPSAKTDQGTAVQKAEN